MNDRTLKKALSRSRNGQKLTPSQTRHCNNWNNKILDAIEIAAARVALYRAAIKMSKVIHKSFPHGGQPHLQGRAADIAIVGEKGMEIRHIIHNDFRPITADQIVDVDRMLMEASTLKIPRLNHLSPKILIESNPRPKSWYEDRFHAPMDRIFAQWSEDSLKAIIPPNQA